jgi:hypothetical protein
MNEIVNEWLIQLINDTIDEAKATISNERIWQNGSVNDDEINSHEFNIQCNELYIEKLEEIKNNL